MMRTLPLIFAKFANAMRDCTGAIRGPQNLFGFLGFLVVGLSLMLAGGDDARAGSWSAVEGPNQGGAKDIGVGADGTVWVIGKERADDNGYKIFKRQSDETWKEMPGAAVRIAVDWLGRAYVANRGGTIFEWQEKGEWRIIDATSGIRAKDISVNAGGAVWIISDRSVGDYGYEIYRLQDGKWQLYSGAGIKIAADETGNRAWVVNARDEIYQYKGGNEWEYHFGAATDISVNAEGAVWVIGAHKLSEDGYGIYKRVDTDCWTKLPGAAVAISVGPANDAWVVNADGDIFRWTESNSHDGGENVQKQQLQQQTQ